MTRLLSIALFAATLSAQTPHEENSVELEIVMRDSRVKTLASEPCPGSRYKTCLEFKVNQETVAVMDMHGKIKMRGANYTKDDVIRGLVDQMRFMWKVEPLTVPTAPKYPYYRVYPVPINYSPISARTYDGNGALEAFYQQPKHHWYASKRFWVPVVAIGAGFAIGVAVNSMRSGVSTYHPSPAMQPSASTPQQPGVFDVTHIGIGGPGIPVVIVHGIN